MNARETAQEVRALEMAKIRAELDDLEKRQREHARLLRMEEYRRNPAKFAFSAYDNDEYPAYMAGDMTP